MKFHLYIPKWLNVDVWRGNLCEINIFEEKYKSIIGVFYHLSIFAIDRKWPVGL